MRLLETVSRPWLGNYGVANPGLRGFEKCLGKKQQSSLKHDHACGSRHTQVGEIFRSILAADLEDLVCHAIIADIAEVRCHADRARYTKVFVPHCNDPRRLLLSRHGKCRSSNELSCMPTHAGSAIRSTRQTVKKYKGRCELPDIFHLLLKTISTYSFTN